jgi:hypothetical protein
VDDLITRLTALTGYVEATPGRPFADRTWVPPKRPKKRPGKYWPSIDLWAWGELILVDADWSVGFAPKVGGGYHARLNGRIERETARSLKQALSDLDITSVL